MFTIRMYLVVPPSDTEYSVSITKDLEFTKYLVITPCLQSSTWC